jgi:hypothetical protein
MEIIRITKTHATLTISREDLGFLQSAINETINALRGSELHTRTGETKEFAYALLDEIVAVGKAIDSQV